MQLILSSAIPSLIHPPILYSSYVPLIPTESLPLSHNEIYDGASSLPTFMTSSSSSETTNPLLVFDCWNINHNLQFEFWKPIYLSTLAGLSTCIGASIAFFVGDVDVNVEEDEIDNDRRRNGAVVGPDLLAFSLALAGSVMITVCLVSIIPEALSIECSGGISGDSLITIFGHETSIQLIKQRTVGFAIGWGVYALLSQLLASLPDEDEWGGILAGDDDGTTTFSSPWKEYEGNDNSLAGIDYNTPSTNDRQSTASRQSSWRLTILLFLSLLLHNFPEGLAVAFSAASDSTMLIHNTQEETSTSLASIVALSIALHNIPEGIAIAIPCMVARPNQPFLAFGLASLSGLAEPVGAFIGLNILKLRGIGSGMIDATSQQQDMGDALSFVAGIMMAVAIFELIPEAIRQCEECEGPLSLMLGIMTGVGAMVLTELYLGA